MPYSRNLAEKFEETPFSQTQQAVCFTETPLAHVRHICAEIVNRATHLRSYGVAFTRSYARRNGVNPLWYLDTTRTGPGAKPHAWLTNAFRDLISEAVQTATPDGSTEPDPIELAGRPIFKLTPFLETMGQTQNGRRKKFWWEREWRKVGPLDYTPEAVVAAVVPERDHARLRAALLAVPRYSKLRFIDTAWDPCKIDRALEGVDASPFTS